MEINLYSISVFIFSILYLSSLIYAQQPYIGLATTDCSGANTSNSVLGYSCNGVNTSCQSYLIFRSQPPYNSVSSISSLLSSDASQVAEINSVSESETFKTDRMVIVPVNCSCSGEYYQANTSYVILQDDTVLVLATETYQGLSTCRALEDQNGNLIGLLNLGTRITVPLRCACPTETQANLGFRYLLSYIVASGDTVFSISNRFGSDMQRTLEANRLSEQSFIFPFTTLLIPLETLPTSSQTILPSPPPSQTPNSSSGEEPRKTWIYILVGVLVGSVVLMGIGVLVFCMFLRRKKMESDQTVLSSESFQAINKPYNKKLDEESQDFFDSMSEIAQSLKVYNYKELQIATDDFGPSWLIKGSVYCGKINGDFAAIKKVNGDVSKEINLLNKINHFNLIRLSGVCFHDGVWYLVYEYAVNGPLSDWIYNNNEGRCLTWTQRIQIGLDVVTGLNYLHSFTNPPHVHKDIKSTNVLLDTDFRAKIANFALARAAEGQDGKFELTRHIVGTQGYMAPEYLENGVISTKLDVYAFGILMLEILTGKGIPEIYGENNMQLPDVLNSLLNNENGLSLRGFIDSSLEGNYPVEVAVFVIGLIDKCLKKDPTSRPPMEEIVQSLSRCLTASLTWDMSNNFSGL